MGAKTSLRRYDLDWIKVIATFIVFLFHCSMFFNPFPWHVKNNEIDNGAILTFSLFIGTWIMPIFFIISGVSSYYSLQKRSWKIYLHERFVRLGIPLLFGVFILSPPQVYIERLDHEQFKGSFFEFFPSYFDGLYLDIGGTGNFAFVGLHLWYLLALLLFSVITVPLFSRTKPIKKLSFRHLVLFPLPLFLLATFIETANLGGWDLLVYLGMFLVGFYLFSQPELLNLLRRTAPTHFFLGILTSTIYVVWFYIGEPERGTLPFFFFTFVMVTSCWNLILFFYYSAYKFLSFKNKVLSYCSEASMPFYVLHQPVIVIVGFLIKDAAWPIYAKLLFLVIISFCIICLTYHFIIRKVPFLRVLFGIKGQKHPKWTDKNMTA